MSNDDTEHEAVVLFKPNVRRATTRAEAERMPRDEVERRMAFDIHCGFPSNHPTLRLYRDYLSLLDEVERLREVLTEARTALFDYAEEDELGGSLYDHGLRIDPIESIQPVLDRIDAALRTEQT